MLNGKMVISALIISAVVIALHGPLTAADDEDQDIGNLVNGKIHNIGEDGVIVLDIGTEDRCRAEMVMRVMRGEKYLGKVRVTKAMSLFSHAEEMKEWTADGATFQKGDLVIEEPKVKDQ